MLKIKLENQLFRPVILTLFFCVGCGSAGNSVPSAGNNVHSLHRTLVANSDSIRVEKQYGMSEVESLGTTYSDELRLKGLLPRGAALLTSSGNLNSGANPIRYIIHAASGSSNQSGALLDPTLEGVRLSILNSIALASKNNISSIAFPYIGGKIFLQRIASVQGISLAQAHQELTDTILKAILEGLLLAGVGNGPGQIQKIYLIAYGPLVPAGGVLGNTTFGSFWTRWNILEQTIRNAGSTHRYFQLVDSVPNGGSGANPNLDINGVGSVFSLIQGDITNSAHHGAEAIVNAANVEVRFGGGVAGAIGSATGKQDLINKEAKTLVDLFNHYLEIILDQNA